MTHFGSSLPHSYRVKMSASFLGCNCSGWVLAFANHFGVSRSAPFHYEVEHARVSWGKHMPNPFHIPGVPVEFASRLPFVATHFERFWGAPPTTVIAHSLSWDSARACKLGSNYTREAFVREWQQNASSFIETVRTVFPTSEILWRTGNKLTASAWQFCPNMWRMHNTVLLEPLSLMVMHNVSVLRWDMFVDKWLAHSGPSNHLAVEAFHQIHPGRQVHRAWAFDVMLPLLSVTSVCTRASAARLS